MKDGTDQHAPAICRGAVYLADDVIERLGISKDTLSAWVDGGLRFSQPSTKRRYFLGDHLIAFMFQDPSL